MVPDEAAMQTSQVKCFIACVAGDRKRTREGKSGERRRRNV